MSHPLLRLTLNANRRKQTRCGFVVSKHIGKAVQRNRAKRRLREAVRLVFDHIAPGVDLVFVIRSPDVADVPFARLSAVLKELLVRAGLWREAAPQQQATEHS